MADPITYSVRIFVGPTYDVLISSDKLGSMLLGQSITWTFEIAARGSGAPFDPEKIRLCLLKPNVEPGGETVYLITFDGDGDPVFTADAVLISFARTVGFAAGSFSAEVIPPIAAASVGTWRVWIEGEDEEERVVLAEESFVRVQAGRVRLPA